MSKLETRVAAMLGLALVAILGSAAAGQGSVPTLPESCRDGEVVVSGGAGRFECVELGDLLRTRSCSSGDLVTVGAFGALECISPSRVDLGARERLLPDCSSGEALVSEGFGRWGCARGLLPDCSSGAVLVSEGFGRFGCASR